MKSASWRGPMTASSRARRQRGVPAPGVGVELLLEPVEERLTAREVCREAEHAHLDALEPRGQQLAGVLLRGDPERGVVRETGEVAAPIAVVIGERALCHHVSAEGAQGF